MDDGTGAGNPSELDEELVARVIGKRLLIGLTYVKHSGDFIEQKQLHGIVEQISDLPAWLVSQLSPGNYSL